jgi:hypothetical protein
VRQHAAQVSQLFRGGASKRQIATQFKISRSSVRRLLDTRLKLTHRNDCRSGLKTKFRLEYRIFQVICKQMAPTGNLDRPVTAQSGPLVIGYTDNAARRSCPILFLRNVGSSYSEEPGVEMFVPWQSSFMD